MMQKVLGALGRGFQSSDHTFDSESSVSFGGRGVLDVVRFFCFLVAKKTPSTPNTAALPITIRSIGIPGFESLLLLFSGDADGEVGKVEFRFPGKLPLPNWNCPPVKFPNRPVILPLNGGGLPFKWKVELSPLKGKPEGGVTY